mmetsp:Transcript_34121/g.62827  ORF Transcript_34121/g.62827 Transcript_34121/m.62827 type:complete len:211 (+) Transcript_34121:418-1050(+)
MLGMRSLPVRMKLFDGSGFHQTFPYAGSCTFYRDVDLDRFGIPGLSTMMTMLVKCLSYVVYVILTVMMWIYPLAWMLNRCSAIVLFGLLDPQSRGRVWVERKRSCKEGWEASRMSEVDIRIDPAYLVDVRDLDQVEYGWRALDGIAPRLFPRALEVLPGARSFGIGNSMRQIFPCLIFTGWDHARWRRQVSWVVQVKKKLQDRSMLWTRT